MKVNFQCCAIGKTGRKVDNMKDIYEDMNIGFETMSEYNPEPEISSTPPSKIIIPIATVIGIIGTIIGICFLAKYIENHFEEIQAFINEAFTVTNENGEEIPLKDKMAEIIKTALPISITIIGLRMSIRFLHNTIKDV